MDSGDTGTNRLDFHGKFGVDSHWILSEVQDNESILVHTEGGVVSIFQSLSVLCEGCHLYFLSQQEVKDNMQEN